MQEEELKQQRDDIRGDVAVQTMKDVLWRFSETTEDTLSLYDLVGYLVEDLVKEGLCAACLNETVAAAFNRAGANPMQHKDDEDSEVFH